MDKKIEIGKTIVFRLIGDEHPRVGEVKKIGHDSVVVETATETEVCVPADRIFNVS